MTPELNLRRTQFIFDASNILIKIIRGDLNDAVDLTFRLTDDQRHELAAAAAALIEMCET